VDPTSLPIYRARWKVRITDEKGTMIAPSIPRHSRNCLGIYDITTPGIMNEGPSRPRPMAQYNYRALHMSVNDIETYVSLNWLDINKFPLDMMYHYW
jgi:hypothetical protein